MTRDTAEGRDLPAEDDVPDLPMRNPDIGYGIDAGDVARGYKTPMPEVPGDARVGNEVWPSEKGFLYRGRLGLDR